MRDEGKEGAHAGTTGRETRGASDIRDRAH